VDVSEERFEVTLGPDGVRVGDDVLHCHLADVEGTPVHLVTIGRAVHRVVARRGGTRGAYTLWIDGHRFEAEALDERTRTIRDLTANALRESGPKPLLAPMPGLIVRVHVQPGDRVEAGQGLDIASMVLVLVSDQDATKVSRADGLEKVDLDGWKGRIDQHSADQIGTHRIPDDPTSAIGEDEPHDVPVALGFNHETPNAAGKPHD